MSFLQYCLHFFPVKIQKYMLTASLTLVKKESVSSSKLFCVLNWEAIQYCILSRIYFLLKVRRPVYVSLLIWISFAFFVFLRAKSSFKTLLKLLTRSASNLLWDLVVVPLDILLQIFLCFFIPGFKFMLTFPDVLTCSFVAAILISGSGRPG